MLIDNREELDALFFQTSTHSSAVLEKNQELMTHEGKATHSCAIVYLHLINWLCTIAKMTAQTFSKMGQKQVQLEF